jgi:hypothetical protein
MSQPKTADLAEQPLTPDVPVTTQVGITLNALPTLRSSIFPVAKQGFSGTPSFGILSTYNFTHACLAEPRLEDGYCTDDMARVLVVATRQPDAAQ